jgi:hypothetical protein
MALTCAERTGALKVGQTKTINYDRYLNRFTLMNVGPVAICCEHNDMNCGEFLVSKEGLSSIELILGYIL